LYASENKDDVLMVCEFVYHRYVKTHKLFQKSLKIHIFQCKKKS